MSWALGSLSGEWRGHKDEEIVDSGVMGSLLKVCMEHRAQPLKPQARLAVHMCAWRGHIHDTVIEP